MTPSTPAAPTPAALPRLECDLVMKGGITSGVVYPLAVCELATVYRLRSVGGSSAGAIAAAAAACAELGRATGGFEKLAQLPHDLTEEVEGHNSRLFTLFQPQPTMRRLFGLVTSGLGTTGATRARAMLAAALKAWLGYALLAAAPGVAAIVIGLFQDDLARWTCIVAGILLALVGLALGTGFGIFRDVGRIPSVGFGLTSGATAPGAHDPALTPWLHETFQTLAGREVDDEPITFGDLDAAGITLRLMTTNLSRRQPTAMPWTTQDYSFDPAHFRTLFPENVVDRMEQGLVRRAGGSPLLPFPAPADLPVVVAVRMSLSFPGLIAAVPLHAVDYSLPVNQEAVAASKPLHYQRNWFSDGGICANLPLQFFDSALPRRPTFAINLAPFPHGRHKSADETENSYLPVRNDAGLVRRQTVLGESGVGALKQFGSTIIDTARTWVDEGQQFVPGYRDRIVTVFHTGTEGGMNLNMPQDVVTGLSERGRGAADRLVEVFAGDQPGAQATWGWDNHRWLRFRTAMAAFSDTLLSFRNGFTTEPPGTTPYSTWVGAGADGPLPSYKVEGAQRQAVNERTQGLLDTSEEWQRDPADAFTRGAPEPRPTMRLVPSDRVGETGPLT